MHDTQATAVLGALLNLAVTIRDEGPDAVQEAVAAVLDTSAGDPAAALAIAAALIPIDRPVDAWWQHPAPVAAGFPIEALYALPTTPAHRCDDALDEVAIEQAMYGRPVRLTHAEKNEAIRRLGELGYGSDVIAARLHLSQRTVVRRRAEIRAA